MATTASRHRRRARLVATHSLNGLLLPALNVLVSLSVIRLASVDLWGSFVQALILVHLAAHVVAWGNKDCLLRAFSLRPTAVRESWQGSLLARSVLLPGFGALALVFGWPPQQVLLVGVWAAGLVVAQSTEVLVVFRRAFGFSILVEAAATTFLLVAVAASGPALTLDRLFLLFATASLFRATAFLLRFRRLVLLGPDGRVRLTGRPDPSHFRLGLPFFLLGLSGMLQSRIDLYSVSFLRPPEDVARYQVFINLIIYVQAVANFIVLPFAKSIYRLSWASTLRISRRLFLAGIPLILLGMAGIHLVVTHLYRFDLGWPFLVLGGLCAWPVFFYVPIIYALYRVQAQSMVVAINVVCLTVNLLLNLYFIPRLGIAGALLSTTAAQWLTLALCSAGARTVRGRYEPAVP
jgi:O-antigen/teichoic acid export membrane protein